MALPGYQLYDTDIGTAASLGAGGNNPCSPVFQADTLAHAQSLAQIWATLMQRACVLVPLGMGNTPYTTYTPAAAGSALGSAPTGITF